MFYTQEQKKRLISIQKSPMANQKPISMALGAAMLDALGEIQNTLQLMVNPESEIQDFRAIIDNHKDDQHIERGEVYYADLDGVVGSEQKGQRPVVVIQNNEGNTYSPTVIVIPATSKAKHTLPTHVPVRKEDGLDNKTIFLCEQIRTIDKSRISKFICRLTSETMRRIENSLKISCGINK